MAYLIEEKTYTGNVVSFDNPIDQASITSLSVPIQPTQNLNGYSKPWAPGTGKNILPYPYTPSSSTVAGIQVTVNDDGSVVLDGTTTSKLEYYLSSRTLGGPLKLGAGNYILTGCPKGYESKHLRIGYNRGSSGTTLGNDTGDGVAITQADTAVLDYGVWISCDSGTILDNLVIKPMVRLASETDPTWEPYRNECPISGSTGLSVNRVGKNWLPNGTLSGDINITQNADGSYTMTGSTSASARIAIPNFWDWTLATGQQNDQKKHLPNGKYYINCGNSSLKLQVAASNNSGNTGLHVIFQDYVGTVTIDDTYKYNWVRLNIPPNVDPNLTFKPIICLYSEHDRSFEPYNGDTYASDWNATAGTVYAGSIDIVSGALKARPQYASYNGETLVGPWLSSMDEYVAGTTPTTGAQVVDLGGTETTYTLTAQTIAALSGANNIWASNNLPITVVVQDAVTGFQGWLIKVGENMVLVPTDMIKAESYKVSPNQRMEESAERDTTGVLWRETVPNMPPKIEFNTPAAYDADVNALNRLFHNAFSDYDERKLSVAYYDPEENVYKTWDCYMPNIEFPMRTIDVEAKTIFYDEIRYAFIGY